MGNSQKVNHQDDTASDIIKRKEEIQFVQDDFIREIQGSIDEEYQILSPPLKLNQYYQLRKAIHKKTTLIRAVFIVNKYKIRSRQRQLLQQQISMLKKIDHPNLVKIYQLYKDTHRFYIICQLILGNSLSSILEDQKYFPQRYAAKIMNQLLSALSYCHQRNVIHSDLKLQNLGFNSNSQQILKIVDFSISRIFRIEQIIEQSKGKAFLSAPESLNRQINSKADIWSCGIILYILLCGEPPLIGKSKKKMMQHIIYFEPNFRESKFNSISQQARHLITKMLKYNPEDRLTAKQCLEHPWMKKFYSPDLVSKQTIKRCLIEFYNYNPSSKLQQASWAFFVNVLVNFQQKQDILKVFKKLDRNFKGQLDQQDLYHGFRQLYDDQKSSFLSRFIMSKQKKIKIRFSQFVTFCTNRQFLISNANVMKIFKILDQDQSGQISVSQLKDMLGSSKELMKQADSNSDGMISQQQFLQMMKQLQNKKNQAFMIQKSISPL